jgi:hypothetical protein
MFKDGQTNVHDEELSDQLSVVSDDLVQNVDQEICVRWRFTISELSCESPQISHSLLYKITTVRLGYHMICTIWVMKMLTSAYKMQRMALALTF